MLGGVQLAARVERFMVHGSVPMGLRKIGLYSLFSF